MCYFTRLFVKPPEQQQAFMNTRPIETAFDVFRAKGRAILFFAGLLLFCPGLVAAGLAELYRADVPVAGQDQAGRAEAFRQGLEKVLRRVVPAEDFASAAVRSVLAKPEACVLQFEYTGAYRYGHPVLRVDFDADRIRQSLRKQGVEVWGPERPEILAWITLEDGQPPRFLGPDSTPDQERWLAELAGDAGLSVTLPLGDLADGQSLTAEDIAAGNAERIRAASARYETAAILAGRLVRKPGGFEGDWRFFRGSREERWQTPAAELRGALNAGLGGVYARLSGQLVPRKAGVAAVELRIVGIASLEDSNRVAAYLGNLSPVTKVEWLSVGAGDAAFRLSVRGGRGMLEETLATGKLLRPAADEAEEPDSSALTYRLLP